MAATVLLIAATTAQAQSIVGRVVDAKTKEPLIGAVVSLQGTDTKTVTDTDGTEIGVITDVDTQTENWLFSVETPDGRTIYIPVHEEFIQDIDHEHKRLQMDLPDGLLDL